MTKIKHESVLFSDGSVRRLPVYAIVRTRRKGRKRGHWCCFVDGVYHDPSEAEAGRMGRNDIIMSWMEFARL